MKAAVIHRNGGPEELVYEELPDPACAEDGIVIDVETVSIEGGDLLARLMTPPLSAAHVVGYIAAGTVREVGAKVTGRRVGERVVTLNANGSHADRARGAGGDGLGDPRRPVDPGGGLRAGGRSRPRTTACSTPATCSAARRC